MTPKQFKFLRWTLGTKLNASLLAVTLIVSGLIILIIVDRPCELPAWTGLCDYIAPTGEYIRGKTLWNWMELLIVPAVLAIGGVLFSWAQRKNEAAIELNRQRDATLQSYLDRMTELVLDKALHDSDQNPQVRNIVQARTRAALSQLDGKRKGALIQFLHGLGLLGSVVPHDYPNSRRPPIVVIGEAADLNGVILTRASLYGVDLMLTDMKGAILSGIDLFGANLSGVDLTRATLVGVNLCKAGMSGSNLKEIEIIQAVFAGADMRGSDLRSANLKGASFQEANLAGAKFDSHTKWPEGFDPVGAEALCTDKVK